MYVSKTFTALSCWVCDLRARARVCVFMFVFVCVRMCVYVRVCVCACVHVCVRVSLRLSPCLWLFVKVEFQRALLDVGGRPVFVCFFVICVCTVPLGCFDRQKSERD